MKNKKGVAIMLGILALASLILGILGFIKSRESNNQKEYVVTYRYYLNDVEVDAMPTNPTLIAPEGEEETDPETNDIEKLYAFHTATCTNKVKGVWDEATWTFTPDNTADSTCKLYFVTTYNTITFEVTNGTLTPMENNKIQRGEDAVVIITPTEGYEYEKSECTNNEIVEWNKEKKELRVKAIYAETTCKVTFKISNFSVEVKVNNGTGATKLEYEYGKKVEVSVLPSAGYSSPEITCTNSQNGRWSNNTFTIEKLTAETTCTLSFRLTQTPVSYNVILDPSNHGVLSSSTPSPISVQSGGSTQFTIIPNEGYTLSGQLCDSAAATVNRSGNIIYITNITGNISCTAQYSQNQS